MSGAVEEGDAHLLTCGLLLARQASLEGTHIFPSYQHWFQVLSPHTQWESVVSPNAAPVQPHSMTVLYSDLVWGECRGCGWREEAVAVPAEDPHQTSPPRPSLCPEGHSSFLSLCQLLACFPVVYAGFNKCRQLQAHISQLPRRQAKCLSQLSDYVLLASTRLQDLGEKASAHCHVTSCDIM